MQAFTGFNGFGQFGCGNERPKNNFTSGILIDERLAQNSPLLVSCSWNYNAYASGKTLVFKGFFREKPNEDLRVSTCDCVRQLAASDRLCLVLLENGKLFKINPKLDNELQVVSCTLTRSGHKRNIFGEQKSADTIKFTFIAIGSNITAAVDDKNVVYSIPLQISQLPKHVRVRQLVCGFEHAMLLTNNGDIYCWGNGLRGQLGMEPLQVVEVPMIVEALAGIKITFIAAGAWHSAAISSFGDVYTWGFNSNGQLGLRIFKSCGLKEPAVYPLPQLIDLPDCCSCDVAENQNCVPYQIFAGARHTILQMRCGSVLVAGWNKHGQLGLPENDKMEQCDMLKKINLNRNFANDVKIVCGPWSTCFTTQNIMK